MINLITLMTLKAKVSIPVSILILALAGAALAAGPAPAGKVQTNCPVLGGQSNKSFYAEYHGQKVYFCCPGCIGTFKSAPEKYLKQMEEQGITPEKAPGA